MRQVPLRFGSIFLVTGMAACALVPEGAAGQALGAVFWTDGGGGKIQTSPLDGSGITTLISGLEFAPYGIAFDPAGGNQRCRPRWASR